MAQLVKKFFDELKKYEKEGTDTMVWAEYAGSEIDEDIVAKFNSDDWNLIKKRYKAKSDNIKSLLAWHIHLNTLDFADIQLQILTDLVLTEQIDVAFEALRTIESRFITSGTDLQTREPYIIKEIKGFFLTEQGANLAEKYFNDDFITKAHQIADECGEHFRSEIKEFIKVIEEYQL